jgi:type IV pilus assembly protein PilE
MTLVELLIIVVIVGILAAIAYPSYRKQVVRSQRTDAKVALQRYAQALENCFTRFHSYDSDDCEIEDQLETAPGLDSNDGHYRVMMDDVDDLTFRLKATPQGAQATDDAECGTFKLDQNNAREVTGAKGATACWK